MAHPITSFFSLPARAKFWTACHHLLLAMTIASATVLAEQTKWFAPFDLITRSLMTYFQAWKDVRVRQERSSEGYETVWRPSAAGDRPLVIVVPQLPVQAGAKGLTPAEFAAALIRAAVRQNPRVLALQLDSLDPHWDDPRLNDPACDFLLQSEHRVSSFTPIPDTCQSPTADDSVESLLRNAAARAALKQVLAEAAKSTPLVIKVPSMPLSLDQFNSLRNRKNIFDQRVALRSMVWALDLCETPNVRIAYDWEPLEGGVIFERLVPSLGNVAYEVHRHLESKRRSGSQQFVAADIDPAMDACAPFHASALTQLIGSFSDSREIEFAATAFFGQIESMTGSSGFGGIGTINSRYHETMTHGIYLDIQSLRPGEPVGNLIPHGLHQKVVFLGDDLIRADLLQLKQRPEVDYQAAVFYSDLHGTIGLRHVTAFLLDVALGTLLGMLFALSWGLYGRARIEMDGEVTSSVQGIFAKIPLYLRSRGILVLNLVLLVCLTWATFALANYFMRKDVWINPLPLVLGMSLKGLLASRQSAGERVVDNGWAFFNHHPDVIIQLPIIVISIGLVLYHGLK
jgi:hypothetical protein